MSDEDPGSTDEPSALPTDPGFAPPGGFSAPGGQPPGPPPSEQPPAPGWWKASDGNWYPPQEDPTAPPSAPPTGPPIAGTPPGDLGGRWSPPPMGQADLPSPGAPVGGSWAPPPMGHGSGHPGTTPDGSLYYAPGAATAPSRRLTGWALGLGIASLLLFWTCGLGVLLGILAVVFGVMGRSRARDHGSSDTGRAQAGIVLGALGIVGGIAFIAWMAVAVWPDVRDEIENELDDGVCDPDIEVFDPDC